MRSSWVGPTPPDVMTYVYLLENSATSVAIVSKSSGITDIWNKEFNMDFLQASTWFPHRIQQCFLKNSTWSPIHNTIRFPPEFNMVSSQNSTRIFVSLPVNVVSSQNSTRLLVSLPVNMGSSQNSTCFFPRNQHGLPPEFNKGFPRNSLWFPQEFTPTSSPHDQIPLSFFLWTNLHN